mgnify:CR=1 FL=1
MLAARVGPSWCYLGAILSLCKLLRGQHDLALGSLVVVLGPLGELLVASGSYPEGDFLAEDIFGVLGLLWKASLQASGRRSEGTWQGPKVAYVCHFRASREEQ